MAQSIDRLLNQVVDKPDEVIQQLQSHPHLASAQDAHGYSLVHAAASYNHPQVLRTLVQSHNVDINIRDEDGETALFSVETVDMARMLIEELHIDATITNDEGQTAADKFDAEQEYPQIAAYLRQLNSASAPNGGAALSVLAQTGNPSQDQAAAGTMQPGESSNGAVPPPPLPHGVKIDLGTMAEDEVGEAPDPEFRRRIDELASRPDFNSEETQRELRNLVQDALTGMKADERDVRQRTQ